jgi:hypothetical protein
MPASPPEPEGMVPRVTSTNDLPPSVLFRITPSAPPGPWIVAINRISPFLRRTAHQCKVFGFAKRGFPVWAVNALPSVEVA